MIPDVFAPEARKPSLSLRPVIRKHAIEHQGLNYGEHRNEARRDVK
jgi:hypothetical protein